VRQLAGSWGVLTCAALLDADSADTTTGPVSGGRWLEAVTAGRRDRSRRLVDRIPRAPVDELESKVTAANQNVKADFARLQQARAQTRIERSAYFPTLGLHAGATRARTSVNSPLYTNARPTVGNDFVLDADLSYEVDVWGRVRNTVTAARASERASAADLASLDLSTHAELATDYFTLCGLDTEQALLEQTVADYTKALQLTQALFDGGAAARGDVDQARAQLESARTSATDIRLRRAQTEHAIAVLVGESPSAFHLDPTPLRLDVAPPPIAAGLPSELLERRPDVAAAERRVAAANAQIGVARAAYFPVFDLSARAGFESTRTSNWIDAPSRLWSVGPSALLTVFDAGLHRAQSARRTLATMSRSPPIVARCSPPTRRLRTIWRHCAIWKRRV